MSRETKNTNVYPFHLEIKKGVLIVYGTRQDKADSQRYAFHIHFIKDWWFEYLGKACVKYLRGKYLDIRKLVANIKDS